MLNMIPRIKFGIILFTGCGALLAFLTYQNIALKDEVVQAHKTTAKLHTINQGNVEALEHLTRENQRQRAISERLQLKLKENNLNAQETDANLENARGRLSNVADKKAKLVEDLINRATADVLCQLANATRNANKNIVCQTR